MRQEATRRYTGFKDLGGEEFLGEKRLRII